jgi:hypothetical protein
MRVSAKGLGRFFMLAGAWGLGGSLTNLLPLFRNGIGTHVDSFGPILMLVIYGFYFLYSLMALANLYIGVNMARLLLEKPHLPIRFTRLTMILSALSLNIVGFLLNGYIWKELKRLASEAEPAVESHTLV